MVRITKAAPRKHPRCSRPSHALRPTFSPILRSNVTSSSDALWTRHRRCWWKVARSSTSCPKARPATPSGRFGGNKSAADALKDAQIPEYSPFDADPHGEYEIGDVDNTVRYASQLASIGPFAVRGQRDRQQHRRQAAAIASRCVMGGHSVLYVPCVTDQSVVSCRRCRKRDERPIAGHRR